MGRRLALVSLLVLLGCGSGPPVAAADPTAATAVRQLSAVALLGPYPTCWPGLGSGAAQLAPPGEGEAEGEREGFVGDNELWRTECPDDRGEGGFLFVGSGYTRLRLDETDPDPVGVCYFLVRTAAGWFVDPLPPCVSNGSGDSSLSELETSFEAVGPNGALRLVNRFEATEQYRDEDERRLEHLRICGLGPGQRPACLARVSASRFTGVEDDAPEPTVWRVETHLRPTDLLEVVGTQTPPAELSNHGLEAGTYHLAFP